MKNSKILALFLISAMVISFLGLISPIPSQGAVQQDTIVFWTTETEASRTAIIEGIASRFTGATVQVVAVDENEFPEQVASAKAADNLPDVMQVFYEYIGGWADEGILDAERATTTIGGISDLGGLPMVTNPASSGDSDKYGAVPIDGWVQGIWYRKDLFTANGLSAPDSYDNIMAAAQKLHNTTDPINPMYGIVIGTAPKAVYTQQVYEHFALANGARALDENGKVNLNTDEQAEALEYYSDLAAYAPSGFNNWDAANQLYLTNKCAMMVYSTFIADDILGLQDRPWTPLPNLGTITGFQAAIEGKHGDKATYGQLSALGISVGANAKAEDFIKFILNTDSEYLEWIHMAITGKMPLKQSTNILANWTQHEVWGSYEGLAEKILGGFEVVGRWGLVEGNSYASKIATLYTELIMPKAIVAVISNITTTEAALETAETDFKEALGEEEAAPGFELIALLSSILILAIIERKRRR
ncbi:MAG: ABC transporter substrate-binding protein [Candidatus Hodarchaeales archaeon]|jgi:multiple sugar transport system substrate-binding protein